METLKFKTSLKCRGCVNAIKPGLESLDLAGKWTVDLESVDKTLQVEAPEEMAEKVMDSVKKAGYLISRL
jgi:copper chaperone CopZ